MIRYPYVEEALELHQRLLKSFGGAQGVRDAGLLESALFRPQTGYYKDVIQMAAALMESLAINHPFVDGNKRVGFEAMRLMLKTVEVIELTKASDVKPFYQHAVRTQNSVLIVEHAGLY